MFDHVYLFSHLRTVLTRMTYGFLIRHLLRPHFRLHLVQLYHFQHILRNNKLCEIRELRVASKRYFSRILVKNKL